MFCNEFVLIITCKFRYKCLASLIDRKGWVLGRSMYDFNWTAFSLCCCIFLFLICYENKRWTCVGLIFKYSIVLFFFFYYQCLQMLLKMGIWEFKISWSIHTINACHTIYEYLLISPWWIVLIICNFQNKFITSLFKFIIY